MSLIHCPQPITHLAQHHISAIGQIQTFQRKVKEVLWLEDCQESSKRGAAPWKKAIQEPRVAALLVRTVSSPAGVSATVAKEGKWTGSSDSHHVLWTVKCRKAKCWVRSEVSPGSPADKWLLNYRDGYRHVCNIAQARTGGQGSWAHWWRPQERMVRAAKTYWCPQGSYRKIQKKF